MKKLIIKSFVTVCLGLTFFLLIAALYSQSVNAAATISYITTSIGENETSMGINYHCSEESSYVQYSTTTAFTKDTTLTQDAVSTLWSKEVDSSDSNTGFEERYVSRVNLTNLQENTQYYYRVVAGSSTSSTYSFKTHSASSTNANILFATDIHAAEGSYSPTRPNKMMENVRNNVRNINLMVLTGDQVDRGGYQSHWDSYYSGMQIYKNIAVAAIPGNHEYYHTSGGEYVSPEFFNQFYNNPQNGATERLNSSYYFKYGNILFIMIDTINQKYLSEQKEWFRNAVENNPAQWIIVGSHANAITGGWYSHDSKWMATNWGPLFEEYQVDLLISGHEHVFIRKNLMYKNEVNSDLGVSYYVSPAAQHKQYAIKDAYKDQVDTYDNVNYKVNTITVSSTKLTVQVYSEDGTKTKNSKTGELLTFDLLPKRSATVKTQKDSTLLNALKLEYDKENDDANITWNKIFYGNVKKVLIERTANETTTNPTFVEQIEELIELIQNAASEGPDWDVLPDLATGDKIVQGNSAYREDGTIIVGTMVDNGAIVARLTGDLPTYTVPAGYHNGEGVVKTEVEEKTVIPSINQTVVTPSAGKLLSKVTIKPSKNLGGEKVIGHICFKIISFSISFKMNSRSAFSKETFG